MMSSPTSSISEFYAGKRILVTGATGFIGKLLIEKLLYSCSSSSCSEGRSIDKIYCLVRDKNGHSAAERLNEITSSKVGYLLSVFHSFIPFFIRENIDLKDEVNCSIIRI